MKKLFAIGLAAALSLTLLAGCGGNNNTSNSAPEIVGVPLEAQGMVGEEWNALEGVTATDKEDGDLTAKITLSAQGLTFTNGKTTPTAASVNGYEVKYSVTDSNGKTTEEFCTFKVKAGAGELENVFTADFTTPTAADADAHYWKTVIDGPEATATLKEGAYVFDVTDLKDAGDDKLMLTRHFGDLTAGEYQFVVWARSSVNTKINLNALLDSADAKTDSWDGRNLGKGDEDNYDSADAPHGLYGAQVETTVKPITLEFSLTEKKINKEKVGILFRICLGGNGNPAQFKSSIEKIAIYKTTGTRREESLFANDFSAASDTQVFVRPDGGAQATAAVENGEAKINVAKYPDAGTVWQLKADVALGAVKIEKGVTYRLKFDITAANAQDAEVVIENGSNNDRAAFLGKLALEAGEKQSPDYTFSLGDADKTIESDAMLRLQIGTPSANVTTNTLTIDNVQLLKITGNQKTDRVAQDKFVLFGEDSSNKTNTKYPYAVYNGSDDKLSNKGVGTAYIEDGKLVYEIHEGSTEGGQNKLVIGYWDNPISLPENAYYVVSFKVKASAAIGMDVCLHDMDCGDNWDNGLLFRRASWMEEGNYQIGTTETTVEFMTDVVRKDSKCELILEFGSAALAKLSGVTIEISEIKIGARKIVG